MHNPGSDCGLELEPFWQTMTLFYGILENSRFQYEVYIKKTAMKLNYSQNPDCFIERLLLYRDRKPEQNPRAQWQGKTPF